MSIEEEVKAMKRKSCIFLIIFLVVLILRISSNTGLAEDVPLEVVKAAEDGLHIFLDKIPQGVCR